MVFTALSHKHVEFEHISPLNEGFHKWGYPNWMVYNGKSWEIITLNDLGVPSISGDLLI